jgi:hypothetical protein
MKDGVVTRVLPKVEQAAQDQGRLADCACHAARGLQCLLELPPVPPSAMLGASVMSLSLML